VNKSLSQTWRFALLLSFAYPLAAFAAGDVPLNPENPKPGMERCAWSLESWGNTGTVERASTDVRKLLKLIYGGGTKDKTAYKHLTCFGVDPKGKITLHVYSEDEKPPQLGMALCTTGAYQWHESKAVDLKKGWNKVEFAVGEKVWKTEASGWKFEVPVASIDDVRVVDLLLFAGDKQGTVYVQGLAYDPDDKGKQVAAIMVDMQSEDIEKRSAAEKAIVGFGRPATEALYQIEEDDRPEVMLRAASALRQIEAEPEKLPEDPAKRAEILKQKEENSFEDLRRNADYTLHSLETQRARMLGFMKEAAEEASNGRSQLDGMKYVDPEKRKVYLETLEKIDGMVKDLQPVFKTEKDAKAAAAMPAK
jgi:hypothetical protein